MPRREGDVLLIATVSADERALIAALARREGCATISQFIRMAINSLALEAGDEAVCLDDRPRGRPPGGARRV
jgi:hypothetical protein